MKPIPLLPLAVLVVTVAAAGTAWHFREPIRARITQSLQQLPAAGPKILAPAEALVPAVTGQHRPENGAAPREAVVYRWVDANGITHFDQHGGAGREAVTLQPDRIQPLDLGTDPAKP